MQNNQRKLSLFDTHCDTAYELYHRGEQLDKNTCHISLETTSVYDKYAQFFAVWSNRRLDDDTCYTEFLKMDDYFRAETDRLHDRIVRVTNVNEAERAWAEGKQAAFFAVEDSRLVGNDLSRIDELYRRGVRYLTIMWGGESCIGGSHDTQKGLTDLGKQVVRRCFELGILPDISHSSEQTVDDIISIAYEYKKPFIATHSNSYSVYPHTRNLRDRHFAVIKELGGIVGVSMCRSHLTDTSVNSATVDDVLRHIDKYMELGGQDIVGFGCDFDGTDLPDGIENAGDLCKVADTLAAHGYPDKLIDKLFFTNFSEFFAKNIK